MVLYVLKELMMAYRMGVQYAPLNKKWRIFRFLFLKYLFQEKVPLTAIIGVTYRCQCRCGHCSVNAGLNNSLSELSTAEVKKCIDEVASLGCLKVNFFGGEPLLRGDIVDLVRHASSRGLFVFLDTNGLLLDKAMLLALKEAGLDCVLVSLDSSVEMKHDASRGQPGLYRRVMEAIHDCVQERVACVVSTIATRESLNSGDLKELIQMASGQKAAAVRVLLPIPSGNWADRGDLVLTENERRLLFKEYLLPGFVYLESGFSYQAMSLNKVKCSAAEKELFYISPYGDVQLCYALPRVYGNVRKYSVKHILKEVFSHKTECVSCGTGGGVCDRPYKR